MLMVRTLMLQVFSPARCRAICITCLPQALREQVSTAQRCKVSFHVQYNPTVQVSLFQQNGRHLCCEHAAWAWTAGRD